MVVNKIVSSSKVNSPKALNICIPPYFPSNRTVLFNGLKARHILTKTTSKQPMRKKFQMCVYIYIYIYIYIYTHTIYIYKEVTTAYRSRDFKKL